MYMSFHIEDYREGKNTYNSRVCVGYQFSMNLKLFIMIS
jgi:hypothetical protein